MGDELKPGVEHGLRVWLPELRELTSARLGIGRTGGSLKTAEILDFDLAHARARDAVHQVWDVEGFLQKLVDIFKKMDRRVELVMLESAAEDRGTYLKRPDLGRRLGLAGVARLTELSQRIDEGGVVVIVSDGLSAKAAENQAVLVLEEWVKRIQAGERLPGIAAVLVTPRARVGLTDHVGEVLGCRDAVIMLGERPGLATPESLGVYYTYEPRLGKTDADRNCISNIHADGLGPVQAVAQIMALVEGGRRHGLGGVKLSAAMVEAGGEVAKLGKICDETGI